MSYIALKSLLDGLMLSPRATGCARKIGKSIEDELRFSAFQKEHPEYYEKLLKDLKSRSDHYDHQRRVLVFKSNELKVNWSPWSTENHVHVGAKFLDIILQTTDIIEKKVVHRGKKKETHIVPSDSLLDWTRRFNNYAAVLHPDALPCVIPPKPWVAIDDGGYYTRRMQDTYPLVKTRTKKQVELLQGDLTGIVDPINKLQNTPWIVNKKVLDVAKTVWTQSLPIGMPQSSPYEVPESPVSNKRGKTLSEEDEELLQAWKVEARTIHMLEGERRAKCLQISRSIRLASEYRDKTFWMVWQYDFRGRMYCTTSGLSPQGSDLTKSLLLFGNSVPLTEEGLYWLRVHGANSFGIDKVPFDERVQWVLDHEDMIRVIESDPITHSAYWVDADSPWQFLAFCIEYGRYLREGLGMATHLPVSVDGTCNGLQHFSGMLLDEVGGKATNLLPQDSPADIYTEVGKVCFRKLDNSEMGERWRKLSTDGVSIPRKFTKRPVMTLPYGSTRVSCVDSLYSELYLIKDEVSKDRRDLYRMALYMSEILWESIGEVVIAARQAMDWLREVASIISKKNHPIVWYSPLGFPVVQDSKKKDTINIITQLSGRASLTIYSPNDKSDPMKNRLGISPNFIHSQDAAHAMMTITACPFKSFAWVHDSFGTHASNIPVLNKVLREQFVNLYSTHDSLYDFKEYYEDLLGVTLPELPRKKNLDLDQVIDSKYFFG